MNRRMIELGLWILTAAAGLAAGVGWARVAAPLPAEAASVAAPPRAARTPDSAPLNAAAETIVERDVFRLARRPAAIAFGAEPEPALDSAMVAEEETPQQPMLRLAGIIGGPPWEAILEGVPSRPSGVLVASGDELDDLRIRRITRDTVVVEGADTTWILTLERRWQE